MELLPGTSVLYNTAQKKLKIFVASCTMAN